MRRLTFTGFPGFYIAGNLKTGLSLNVGRSTCGRQKVRTTWCSSHCYMLAWPKGKPRHCTVGCSVGCSTPMSWVAHRYEKVNQAIIEIAGEERLEELTAEITQRVQAAGFDNLRICGGGELFPELTELTILLQLQGLKCWGFSRNVAQLQYMVELCESVGWDYEERPVFRGSLDPSTHLADAEALRESSYFLGSQGGLAYATCSCGLLAKLELDKHPMRKEIDTVFGFHAGSYHTKLYDAVGDIECPATGGRGVTCQTCRRCVDSRAS